MTFREWTEADIQEIAALVVRCDATVAAWTPGFELPDGHAEREIELWREELGNDDWHAEVVVDSDGSIVGVLGIDGPHLASLFVEPRLHGQGIGTSLLERAEAWMRENGHQHVSLNVIEGSPAARLYERNGWTLNGDRNHYEAFDLPTIGYAKEL